VRNTTQHARIKHHGISEALHSLTRVHNPIVGNHVPLLFVLYHHPEPFIHTAIDTRRTANTIVDTKPHLRMTEGHLRLREIAALSWTAVRARDGNVEEMIATLQRAISVTKRWLAEVEAEIVWHAGVEAEIVSDAGTKRSELHSSGGVRSNKCTCAAAAHLQPVAPRPPRRCCVLSRWKAYWNAKPTRGSKDLNLLCHKYQEMSARVKEAQMEIERLGISSERGRRSRRLLIQVAKSDGSGMVLSRRLKLDTPSSTRSLRESHGSTWHSASSRNKPQ
jgi:hypothetical protein